MKEHEFGESSVQVKQEYPIMLLPKLSADQHQAVMLILKGVERKKAAEMLGIQYATLRIRLNIAYKKLHVSTAEGAAAAMIHLGLCNIEDVYPTYVTSEKVASLNKRERTNLDLAAGGLSYQQIADLRGKARDTVRLQMGSMYRRLGLFSIAQATIVSLKMVHPELVHPSPPPQTSDAFIKNLSAVHR
jgi:DNA-binding CsgD family transcriptional regulator